MPDKIKVLGRKYILALYLNDITLSKLRKIGNREQSAMSYQPSAISYQQLAFTVSTTASVRSQTHCKFTFSVMPAFDKSQIIAEAVRCQPSAFSYQHSSTGAGFVAL